MDALRLVVVGVEGAVNLGFLARLAENFDVDEMYLVAPKASLEEARRYAARAISRLEDAIVVSSLKEALKGVTVALCTSSFQSSSDAFRAPLSPREAAEIMSASPGIAALVLGRESVGLTRSEIAMCNLYSSIPASPKYPSLNLSNAAAIYLYELYLARYGGHVERDPATLDTLNLLEAYTRSLASRLIGHERRDEVIVSISRLAAKNIAARREVENLLYLLAKACRFVEGCQDEVSRYMQPRDRGYSGRGDRVGDRPV